jgi:uncharacterized membrane protein YeaQ/YmgE (transglycosylase-associated protein family)
MPAFIVIIFIGGAVGFVARFLYPGPNTVHGFVLTTVLGVAGAALATFIERYFDLIPMRQLADPISMIVGAIIVLFVWNRLANYRIVHDPGMHAHSHEPKNGRET